MSKTGRPVEIGDVRKLRAGRSYKVEVSADIATVQFTATFVGWTIEVFIPEDRGGDGNKLWTRRRVRKAPTRDEFDEGYVYTRWSNGVVAEHCFPECIYAVDVNAA